MIPGSANPLLLADAGYQIQRSLRFRSSASAYLNRTPAIAGNRKTWTWSGWVKRGQLSTRSVLFSQGVDGNTFVEIEFSAADQLIFQQYSSAANQLFAQTSAVYRDPSASYHLCIVCDTTAATASSRIQIAVNGNSITAFAAVTYPVQNIDTLVNSTNTSNIGRLVGVGAHFDGYLSEVNFIDGQALTPSSFGEISPVTGQWQAKRYSGTYGTNGFYLPFTDNSAATATAIGADKSGNGNNWTPNNISLTAGASYDSMLDVPLGAGGAERGNYCTLNYLSTVYSSNLSNGNLNFVNNTTGQYPSVGGTIGVSSGKWYYEAIPTFASTLAVSFGFTSNTSQFAYAYQTLAGSVEYSNNGTIGVNGSTVATVSTYGVNDVIGIALNLDAGTAQFYKNGVVQSYTVTGLSGLYVPAFNVAYHGLQGMAANFGQRPWAYTPPTGFKALHTGNLPDPVIKLPAQYMAATTYTGNGTSQSISNAVNGVGFQPDLVWVKNRAIAASHLLNDSVRGGTATLFSDQTVAESVDASRISGLTGNGFSVGSAPSTNGSGNALVGWQWKANGAAVANNAGSIASQVSAGVAQGFSVVTYTGTGANATVGHGLGVAPKMVIVKCRSVAGRNWPVYHSSNPAANTVWLNTINASQSAGAMWNSTAPTSLVFNIGADESNTIGATHVAYCFSEVSGYSKMGLYVGNGNSDGTFVYCGFRPRFVMVKRTDTTSSWIIKDTARSAYNAGFETLYPNLTNLEAAGEVWDSLSNGFKLRNPSTETNASGGTHIFMAFAESPFKYSLGR